MQKNSVKKKLPKDRSDYNTFSNNVFGRGVRAENLDIKEYTSHGKVFNNHFNGKQISGENGAISFLVIKGNNWRVENNVGIGAMKDGVGYRVAHIAPGQGFNNSLLDNKCAGFTSGDFCVFIDPGTSGNFVNCLNTVTGSPRAQVCNCAGVRRCGKKLISGGSSRMSFDATPQPFVTSGYAVPGMVFDDSDTRPEWD